MGTKDSIDEFLERACRIFPHIDPEVEGAVDRICKLNKRFDTMLEHAVEEFGLNKGEFKVLITLRSTTTTSRCLRASSARSSSCRPAP